MNENRIASVDYIPPCYLQGRKGYNVRTRRYVNPITRRSMRPVYIRINGRTREAKRWLWLWRIVARVQG